VASASAAMEGVAEGVATAAAADVTPRDVILRETGPMPSYSVNGAGLARARVAG